jgi:hypothetical protein
MASNFWAGFGLGVVAGVFFTIGVLFIAAVVNWLLTRHER